MHLSYLNKFKFELSNHKSKYKLDNLLYNTKTRILNMEIADLYRLTDILNKEILTLTRKLSDIIPIYIWKHIGNRITRIFGQ